MSWDDGYWWERAAAVDAAGDPCRSGCRCAECYAEMAWEEGRFEEC